MSKLVFDATGKAQPLVAVLDLVIFAGLPPRMLCVDVTIRDPLAGRNSSVMHTGEVAQREKTSTYNQEVLALVLNPYGRFQPSAQRAIFLIAQVIASAGKGLPAAAIRRRLAAAIEQALYQGISDTTLKCLGTLRPTSDSAPGAFAVAPPPIAAGPAQGFAG